MSSVVVIGGGGHAKVLMAQLKRLGWSIVGFTDDQARPPLLGLPCLGGDAVLSDVLRTHPECSAVIGVGKIDASQLRVGMEKRARDLGFHFPVIISPDAVVHEDAELGAGTVVLDGAVVNIGAVLGRLCIVNTNGTVEHDCRLGDNVHIAPGATVCGTVRIGDHCMIGAGSTIVQNVTVCTGTLVGAGAVVLANIDEPGMYAGNPAKRIK